MSSVCFQADYFSLPFLFKTILVHTEHFWKHKDKHWFKNKEEAGVRVIHLHTHTRSLCRAETVQPRRQQQAGGNSARTDRVSSDRRLLCKVYHSSGTAADRLRSPAEMAACWVVVGSSERGDAGGAAGGRSPDRHTRVAKHDSNFSTLLSALVKILRHSGHFQSELKRVKETPRFNPLVSVGFLIWRSPLTCM